MSKNSISHNFLSTFVKRLRMHVSFVVVGLLLSVQVQALPAFPGAQGYGTNTTHGRGGRVIKVTNLNNSGSGSLRACMEDTGPRNCVFEVSGTITLTSAIRVLNANSNLAVYGQTAPGDGITLRASGDFILLRLGQYQTYDPAENVLIQHIRFRHGAPESNDGTHSDNLDIFAESNNIVIDHCSFTWAADENVSFWDDGVKNVTMSHNIFAEGVTRDDLQVVSGGVPEFQNTGVLMSGGNGSEGQNQISFHHNLFAHTWYRVPRITTSAPGPAGSEWINNVHYNSIRENFGIVFKNYTGSGNIRLDIVGSLFKQGPDSSGSPPPMEVTRQGSGTFGDLSIHFSGSADLNINGNSTSRDDQNNNFNMITVASSATSVGIAVIERANRFSNQPVYPVFASSYGDAYQKVVIAANVGALPHDSVDARIVRDVEDGSGWSASNIPPPHGSGSYPTLTTGLVPVDSDDDGVPDSFEVTVLNSDPQVVDSHLDHDSNGYTNLEAYVHALVGVAPKPPIIAQAN